MKIEKTRREVPEMTVFVQSEQFLVKNIEKNLRNID
jgi:hypothetical protein